MLTIERSSPEQSEDDGLLAFAPDWVSTGAKYNAPPVPISHPAFDRMMARVPNEIRRTFTPQQLVALSRGSVPINSPHSVDFRVSVPFFRKRFYVTLLAGRERRSRARLVAERQLPSALISSLNSAAFCLLLSIGIFGSVVGLYVIKSALGIDMFEGDSSMHEIFRQLSEPPSP